MIFGSNIGRDRETVLDAVTRNGPVLATVVDRYLSITPDGDPVISDDRQAAFLNEFAQTLAESCANESVGRALKVGRAFSQLAGHPQTMIPIWEAIIAELTPLIPTLRARVALIVSRPMGTA